MPDAREIITAIAFADNPDTAQRVKDAIRIDGDAVVKIGNRIGFPVLPSRWDIERFFVSAEAFLRAALAMQLVRRLAGSA